MHDCRLCSLRGIKEWQGTALQRNRGLQRSNSITSMGVVRDLLLGSMLLLLGARWDHLHRVSIHDERIKRVHNSEPTDTSEMQRSLF